jgi:Flp pilus assembly protein TadG
MKPHLQKGAVAILVAVLLPTLMGLMALAIDVGFVLLRRNQMQVAADSAALLAANARQHGEDISTATDMAYIATAANGFQNQLDSTAVTVSIPPGGSQSFASDTNYVRVTLTQPVHAFLAWIFGVTHTNPSATAIAGPAGNGNPCLLTLGSSGSAALSVVGNSVVTASTCGIYINSNSPAALQLTGNATVTARTIQVVGGYTATGNVNVSAITTGAAVTADPFASLPMPAFNSCNHTNYAAKGNGSLTLTPGTYCGGISITGTHAVTFSPGLYVLYGGGISFTGNAAPITGNGVTFYNSGNSTTHPYQSLDLGGNVALNFTAPTTGTYAGMLVMQDPLNTQAATIVGNTGSTLAGNLYFPKNIVTLNGNTGTDIPIGTVVAQRVSVTGNAGFSMTNTYGGGGTSTLRSGLYQ